MEIPVEIPQQAAAPVSAFQALPMPVRSFTGAGVAHYKVYDGGQCKEVEAETAAEALKASGMEAPLRIEREIRGSELLIDLAKLLGDKSVSAAAPPAAEAPVAPPPAADAPAAPPAA